MPYNKLTAIVDPYTKKVLYIEEYGPSEGVFVEGWRALHYPLTSSLVEKSYREGSATVARIIEGDTTLQLQPSISPFGISRCKVNETDVEITFAGLGGAGVSAAYSRGMAQNVHSVEIHSDGGGTKVGSSTVYIAKSRLLLIGVDDTDNDDEGATYALVDTIAKEICSKTNTRYLSHVNVQLYPYNEFKTRNCFATVIAINFVNDTQKKRIVAYFKKELKAHTASNQTAMAVREGFDLPAEFVSQCDELKFRMLYDFKDFKKLLTSAHVDTYVITGERGLFGAVGALGFWDRPDFAAKLPSQCD